MKTKLLMALTIMLVSVLGLVSVSKAEAKRPLNYCHFSVHSDILYSEYCDFVVDDKESKTFSMSKRDKTPLYNDVMKLSMEKYNDGYAMVAYSKNAVKNIWPSLTVYESDDKRAGLCWHDEHNTILACGLPQ